MNQSPSRQNNQINVNVSAKARNSSYQIQSRCKPVHAENINLVENKHQKTTKNVDQNLKILEKKINLASISATSIVSNKNCKSDSDSDGMECQEKPRACTSHARQDIKRKIHPVSLNNRNKLVKSNATTIQRKSQKLQFVHLPTDILEHICKYLPNNDQHSLITADQRLSESFTNSVTVLKKFNIVINRHNISTIIEDSNLRIVALRNLSINFESLDISKRLLEFVETFKSSIENLELENAKFKNFDELNSFFIGLSTLKSVNMKKCSIDQQMTKPLLPISTLRSISIDKCNDNIFKAFANQPHAEKLSIRNDDWTWNGFPHDVVNDMLFNCPNIKHLVLIGSGTGSFFDSDNFSFRLRKLETTMITFHWYVGIKNGRTGFLQTQKGFLEDLTIHKLPNDFDGGKVLKYIVEEMGLKNFYYGKIPLILNGKKQNVEEFEANEIQITAMFEMFEQFPNIKRFRLNLSQTDIASDEVEKRVNPPTKSFENLEVLEVVDNSRYRGSLGVYLGMFKNMHNLRKLILITQDRNINTLLEEFLRHMPFLIEIYITSKAPRAAERFKIINRFVPSLKNITVDPSLYDEAQKYIPNTIIYKTDQNDCLQDFGGQTSYDLEVKSNFTNCLGKTF